MALTQNQWYLKLRSFIPQWYFEDEDNQVAHLQALAKLFANTGDDIDDHIGETFIATAEGDYLDAHGDERSILRLTGEADAQYSGRIRYLANQSNKVAIKAAVDSVLIAGECEVNEDYIDRVFCDRSDFLNRKDVLIEPVTNTFTVVIDEQTPDPSGVIYEVIQSVIDRIKAFGCLYRVIVRE